jgi:hypothetical protein
MIYAIAAFIDWFCETMTVILVWAFWLALAYGVFLLFIGVSDLPAVKAWLNSPPACSYRAEPQGDGTYKLYRC